MAATAGLTRAQIQVAKASRALDLRRLAPTVLASAKPPTETLAALRTAGYAPVGAAPVLELAPRQRTYPPSVPSDFDDEPKVKLADPVRLARKLLR